MVESYTPVKPPIHNYGLSCSALQEYASPLNSSLVRQLTHKTIVGQVSCHHLSKKWTITVGLIGCRTVGLIGCRTGGLSD